METKHTAALPHTATPWRYSLGGANLRSYSQSHGIVGETTQNGAQMIAGCFCDVRGGEEQAEANAALIVAAVNAWNDPAALRARLVELEGRDETQDARRYRATREVMARAAASPAITMFFGCITPELWDETADKYIALESAK